MRVANFEIIIFAAKNSALTVIEMIVFVDLERSLCKRNKNNYEGHSGLKINFTLGGMKLCAGWVYTPLIVVCIQLLFTLIWGHGCGGLKVIELVFYLDDLS